jgi:L-iditol 2-dehydrogenase
MATCKAAVFVGVGRPLEIQEFPIPDLEPGAVLVKMDMAAVCATDVHNCHNPAWPHPMIFGHENIGVIDRLGKGVHGDVLGHPLKEGDRVIFRSTPCGRCFHCSIGENCQVVKNYGFIPCDKPPYLRGGFGQYLYLDPTPWLLRIPDGLSNDRALMSVIGNHTVLNGIERIGGIGLSDTVVVQGAGPIGMGALTQARVAGAHTVIVIGGPPSRLALARDMGADETIDLERHPEPGDRVAKVRELTRGRGADVVVECSGGDTAFQEGLEMVRVAGKYLVVGQLREQARLPVTPALITRKVLRLNGVISSKPHHIIRTVQMMERAVRYPVEKLITHRFPLTEVNRAFKSHETWEAMVAVVHPNA